MARFASAQACVVSCLVCKSDKIISRSNIPYLQMVAFVSSHVFNVTIDLDIAVTFLCKFTLTILRELRVLSIARECSFAAARAKHPLLSLSDARA